jgi:DNA-binding response OmpR family regulator
MLIKRLRKKITDVSGGVDYIRTIYGLGYVVRDLAESV